MLTIQLKAGNTQLKNVSLGFKPIRMKLRFKDRKDLSMAQLIIIPRGLCYSQTIKDIMLEENPCLNRLTRVVSQVGAKLAHNLPAIQTKYKNHKQQVPCS